MALIGNIVIGMETNVAGFKKGLVDAKTSLLSFGSSLKSIGPSLARLGAEAATLGAAVTGVAVTALAALAKESASAIDELNDMSERLGTTTEGLGALRYAAKLTGSETQSLDMAMQKMNANLGDAARMGGPVALALARIGLDAKNVSRLDPSEAFKQILAGLAGIPNTAERASVAMDIFGKGGMALLSTIAAGPEQVDRLIAEFNRLGGSVSKLDAQKIGSMWDAVDHLSTALGGLGNKVAVSVSPFIQAAADSTANFIAESGSMDSVIVPAIELVSKAAGFLGDAFDVVRFSVKKVQIWVMQGVAEMLRALDQLGNWLDKQFGGGMRDKDENAAFVQGMDDAVKAQQEELAKSLEGTGPGDRVRDFFDGIKRSAQDAAAGTAKVGEDQAAAMASADKQVTDLAKNLNAEIAAFGKVAGEAELYKLKLEGATDAQLDLIRGLYAQKKALEDDEKIQQKRMEKAREAREETRTPQEQLTVKQQELSSLRSLGAIDFETFRRGSLKAKSEFASGQEGKGPALLEHGSQEARSALMRNNFDGHKNEEIKDVAKNTQEALKYQAAMQRALENIGTALGAGAETALRVWGFGA